MLELLAGVLKSTLQPASAMFVIAALASGVLITWLRATVRLAKWYWLALLTGYTLLATPVVADWLAARSGDGFHRLQKASDARGARVIVVLGGGAHTFRAGEVAVDAPTPATIMRTLEASRLYHMLGDPTVILSGGVTDLNARGARPESEAMRTIMLELGVPPKRLVLESAAMTTHEEADEVRRLLGTHASDPILLVTSPAHMKRSIAVFKAAGMNPVPAVSPAWSERSPLVCRWCPSDEALLVSDSVVYDTIAWLYYRARGWVSEK